MSAPILEIKWLEHGLGLDAPSYESDLAAGMDMRAALPEDAPLSLKPGAQAMIETGFAMALPPGYEAQVRPRSGLAAKHGITVLNTPGTIDADYRGEVKIILINLGQEDFIIERGMRIAQMVIAPVVQAQTQIVDTLSDTQRGEGGFGSTGTGQAMIRLSRKSLLALEAVLDVALHARPNPVQARDITARQGVPQRYLEQVMQALVRAGILRGVRGPRGGYRLARERRRISVREIFEVIENIDGNDADMLSKSDLGRVVIAPFHANMQEALIGAVGDTTIADLCSQADMSGSADKADFTI